MKHQIISKKYLLLITIALISAWLLSKQNVLAKTIVQSDTGQIYLPLIENHNPPRPGDVLFEDDFEDEFFTTSKWFPVAGIWKVFNGRYYLSETGRSVVGITSWSNYTYYVDVMGRNVVDKIINFRYISESEAYGVDSRTSPYNDLVLVKNFPGEDPKILDAVSIHNYNNAWYSFKIKVVGPHIEIYVNDLLTLDYYDNSFPIMYGKVGVGGMLNLESEVYFDNVKVIAAEP